MRHRLSYLPALLRAWDKWMRTEPGSTEETKALQRLSSLQRMFPRARQRKS